MDLGSAGLRTQPFPTHGKPSALLSYASERDAIEMLRSTCKHPDGLSLLQGPPLSGKSTLVHSFAESTPEDCAAAVVDGRGLNASDFLKALLSEFGYNVKLSSANELLGLVRMFALQQAASGEPPLLIVENTHLLNPSALRTLCELADLRIRSGSALKMILVSSRSLGSIIASPAMKPVAKRLLQDFHLHPMTQDEVKHYLYVKLRAAGSDLPESIFPEDVCRKLWDVSSGWPGIIDRVAVLALASAEALPVTVDEVERPALPAGTWDESAPVPELEVVPAHPPQLIVTNHGSVLTEMSMEKPRLLIGRSEHNDIAIDSRFISRHHALLIRHGAATFLMDLNSTNGSYVNSRRVSNHVLGHDDVITIGHHRIKFRDPHATSRSALSKSDFADTDIMKTLDDMRKLLARENTSLLPDASEDLPTILT